MAQIDFTVSHQFAAPSRVVWDEMIDWPSHADWIPATRMEVDSDNAQVEGATFTGYTGYKKLALVDRMRISAIEWDETTTTGSCEVEKLGPVLQGRAGFVVTPHGEGSSVEWFEQVTVPYLPRVFAPIVNKLSALGFSLGMRRLAQIVETEHSSNRVSDSGR
ncbi:MAG: SRPBCC family protein [Acidimicrobiales bacterium]